MLDLPPQFVEVQSGRCGVGEFLLYHFDLGLGLFVEVVEIFVGEVADTFFADGSEGVFVVGSESVVPAGLSEGICRW